MQKPTYIKIKGIVAEIIDEDQFKHITIVSSESNLMVTIDSSEDISLGDTIIMDGGFSVESMSINGIDVMAIEI